MAKYICFSPAKEEFDFKGNSLGMGHARALYYATVIGKRRVYRSAYPVPSDKKFRLFEYKTERGAIDLCKEINEAYNDNFSPMIHEAVAQ